MKPLLGLFLFALAACDSNDLPHVFSGNEVPQNVMAEPRLVESPPQKATDQQTWMRLGDVPSMPHDFTPQLDIDGSKQQLINDQIESGYYRQEADMPLAPPAPPKAKASSKSSAPPAISAAPLDDIPPSSSEP